MKYAYTCFDCIQTETSKSVQDLEVSLYNELCDKYKFLVKMGIGCNEVQKCPICGSENTHRLLGMQSNYVVGYGFMDKRGAKNDMNLHLMANNADPYKGHRPTGEKHDVIHRLKKNQQRNTRGRRIHL